MAIYHFRAKVIQRSAGQSAVKSAAYRHGQLHLMLTDCILHLEGRNLTDLRKRLARRRVTFIRAFNPALWPAPQAGEPLIERITLHYPGEGGAP